MLHVVSPMFGDRKIFLTDIDVGVPQIFAVSVREHRLARVKVERREILRHVDRPLAEHSSGGICGVVHGRIRREGAARRNRRGVPAKVVPVIPFGRFIAGGIRCGVEVGHAEAQGVQLRGEGMKEFEHLLENEKESWRTVSKPLPGRDPSAVARAVGKRIAAARSNSSRLSSRNRNAIPARRILVPGASTPWRKRYARARLRLLRRYERALAQHSLFALARPPAAAAPLVTCAVLRVAGRSYFGADASGRSLE